jgi:ribonuclease HI
MDPDLMNKTPGEEPGVIPEIDAGPWRVWSDGASIRNPGPAAWAILARRPDGTGFTRYGSAAQHTNNRAEMFALLQAIIAVPLDQLAVIYSDSTHAIGAATTWRRGWEKNGMRTSKKQSVEHLDLVGRLWEELDKRPGMVRLQWVRGHAGDEGNELVDALANRAARAVQAGGKPKTRVTRELAA